jgi:hypothetical protein
VKRPTGRDSPRAPIRRILGTIHTGRGMATPARRRCAGERAYPHERRPPQHGAGIRFRYPLSMLMTHALFWPAGCHPQRMGAYRPHRLRVCLCGRVGSPGSPARGGAEPGVQAGVVNVFRVLAGIGEGLVLVGGRLTLAVHPVLLSSPHAGPMWLLRLAEVAIVVGGLGSAAANPRLSAVALSRPQGQVGRARARRTADPASRSRVIARQA